MSAKKQSPKKSTKKVAIKKVINNPEQFHAFRVLKKLGHNLIRSTGFNAKLDYVAELNNPFSASHPAVNIGRSVTGTTLFIPKGMTGETLESVKEKFTLKNNAKNTQDGIRKVSRTIFETIDAKKTRRSKSGRPVRSSGKSTRVPGINKRSLVLECFTAGKTPKQCFEALAEKGITTTMPSIRWWYNDFKNSAKPTDFPVVNGPDKTSTKTPKLDTIVPVVTASKKKLATKKQQIIDKKKTAKSDFKKVGTKRNLKVKV